MKISLLLAAIAAVAQLPLRAKAFSSPTPKQCTVKVCHNKDCTKKGGGEPLLNTFRDLLPPDVARTRVSIETSGCLSQCGKGPNVCVVTSFEGGGGVSGEGAEKLYFGVKDATEASALLDVSTGEEYDINFLVAATVILQSENASSPPKKEKLLNSIISKLSSGDASLSESHAHARALLLRADARLDLSPPNVTGALADARAAAENKALAAVERKVWRVLASAEEAAGNISEAIAAVSQLTKVDPSFATKAKKEISRLSALLVC